MSGPRTAAESPGEWRALSGTRGGLGDHGVTAGAGGASSRRRRPRGHGSRHGQRSGPVTNGHPALADICLCVACTDQRPATERGPCSVFRGPWSGVRGQRSRGVTASYTDIVEQLGARRAPDPGGWVQRSVPAGAVCVCLGPVRTAAGPPPASCQRWGSAALLCRRTGSAGL